jgi:hypothetical protein
MIKAVLRYTDCLQDGKNVYTVLTKNKVTIIGTKRGSSVHPKVTVLLKNYAQLSDILQELNTYCDYEVSLVRYKTIKER